MQEQKEKEMDEKLVFSVVEAGRLLSLGRSGSYAAVSRGDLPVIKIGKRLLVPRVALEKMLAQAKPKTDGKPPGQAIIRH